MKITLYTIFILACSTGLIGMEQPTSLKRPALDLEEFTIKKPKPELEIERKVYLKRLPADLRNYLVSFLTDTTGPNYRITMQKAVNNTRLLLHTIPTTETPQGSLTPFEHYVINHLAEKYADNNIFRIALLLGTPTIIDWLRTASYDFNQKEINNALEGLIYCHSAEAIGNLSICCPHLINDNNNPVIVKAAQLGRINVVKKLIEVGANVNIQNSNQETALLEAIENNNTGIAQLLLNAHANPHIPDNANLYHAIKKNNLIIVDDLIAAKVNVNITPTDAPLILATQNFFYLLSPYGMISGKVIDSIKIIKALIKAGANVNVVNDLGQTPLLVTLHSMDSITIMPDQVIELLKIYINAGAKLEIKDNEGNTALSLAAKLDNRIAINLLLEAGADKTGITISEPEESVTQKESNRENFDPEI